MKKYIALVLMLGFALFNGQEKESANRFFYELTFKPGTERDSLVKEMTVLDITPKQSIYRDYLMVSQDSILKIEVENMMKSGAFKDISKSVKPPKFSYRVTKNYPEMGLKFTDYILQDKISYEENTKFDWKISNEKTKIGEYNAQKATTDFGGRKWTAWFTTDIPFQDGPYKFYGLPGLIVKLEDDKKNYSWELKGNKKINDFDEQSYAEKIMKQFGQGRNDLNVKREKYEQVYEAYRKDPFGNMRTQIAQIPADAKMPDGTSISQMLKEQEAKLKKHLSENNNSIELPLNKNKK